MDMSSTINRHFQQTKGQFYQNSGYCDSRTGKQLLTIHVDTHTEDGINFSETLHEPLKIDTLSDVYLDNFTTFSVTPNTDTKAFILSINEFPIKTNSNDAKLYNKLVIPNEATTGNETRVHKGRKMNYICTLNPQTLTKISGKFTTLDELVAYNNIKKNTNLVSGITIGAVAPTENIWRGAVPARRTNADGVLKGVDDSYTYTITVNSDPAISVISADKGHGGFNPGDILTFSDSTVSSSGTGAEFTLTIAQEHIEHSGSKLMEFVIIPRD